MNSESHRGSDPETPLEYEMKFDTDSHGHRDEAIRTSDERDIVWLIYIETKILATSHWTKW